MVKPLLRDCSPAKRKVRLRMVGGFWIWPKMELPDGRS